MCVPACINNMLTHRGGLLGVLGFRDSGPMVGTNINGKSGFRDYRERFTEDSK